MSCGCGGSCSCAAKQPDRATAVAEFARLAGEESCGESAFWSRCTRNQYLKNSVRQESEEFKDEVFLATVRRGI